MNLSISVLQKTLDGGTYGALAVDAGGTVIGGVGNVSASSFHVQPVTDNDSVDISVTQPGFHTYTMTIDNVYEEDRNIVILMVDLEDDISSDEYNKPYPYFFYFSDPCSYDIDYYNASGFGGTTEWYVDNESVSIGNKKGAYSPCQPKDLQLKVRGTMYNNDGTIRFDRVQSGVVSVGDDTPNEGQGIDNILQEDLSSNITVVEYKPTYSFEVDQTSGYIEDCECYLENLGYTLVPSITLPNANDFTITYSLINGDGETVETVSYPITGAVTDYDYEFTLESLGDYTVDIVINDTHCTLEYNETVLLTACDYINLKYSDCGQYKLSNLSSTKNVDYVISDLYGNDTDVTELAAEGVIDLSFTKYGTYTLAITDEDELTTYRIIHNYCNLESCFKNYMLDILCGNTLDCTCDYDASAEIKLIRLWTLYNTYFMKLQDEFTFNTYYTALSDTKIDDLTEIDALADKIATICDRENCGNNTCDEVGTSFSTSDNIVMTIGFSTTTTSDCGCS